MMWKGEIISWRICLFFCESDTFWCTNQNVCTEWLWLVCWRARSEKVLCTLILSLDFKSETHRTIRKGNKNIFTLGLWPAVETLPNCFGQMALPCPSYKRSPEQDLFYWKNFKDQLPSQKKELNQSLVSLRIQSLLCRSKKDPMRTMSKVMLTRWLVLKRL